MPAPCGKRKREGIAHDDKGGITPDDEGLSLDLRLRRSLSLSLNPCEPTLHFNASVPLSVTIGVSIESRA